MGSKVIYPDRKGTFSYGPANVASGTSTLYTGVANQTYRIKVIRIVNNSGGSITFKLGIGGVADANLIIPQITIASGDTVTDDSEHIFSGATTLQASTSASGLTIALNGEVEF